jgi:hypothetical protein
MANPARRPGKRGLRPRDKGRKVPYLEHYLRPWEGPVASRRTPGTSFPHVLHTGEPLPPVGNADVDRLSAISQLPMYGNDTWGDCFWAGAGHSFGAMSVYAGWQEALFSDDAILAGYASTGFDPATGAGDNGTDPAQGLKYLATTGLAGMDGRAHKLAAYAFFRDPTDLGLIAQVLAATGSVGIAFNCTQGYEDAFSAGQPATYHPGDPVVGGHWVVRQRRSVGETGTLWDVTWGGVQRMTRRYHWHQVTDVVMLVSEDYIRAGGTTLQGLDLEQLISDTADAE